MDKLSKMDQQLNDRAVSRHQTRKYFDSLKLINRGNTKLISTTTFSFELGKYLNWKKVSAWLAFRCSFLNKLSRDRDLLSFKNKTGFVLSFALSLLRVSFRFDQIT